jgi:hypothetical protein
MANEIDLKFSDFLAKFSNFGKSEWITVYANHRDNSEWTGFYCALISNNMIEKSLSDPSWDLSIGHGLPGFVFHSENGKEIATYYRYSDEGIEPLVIWRSFYGMKDGYCEISEEFRHYFNLYEDKVNNKFIKIDDNGDDEDVILTSENEIKIKLRLIKEFLAVKKMHLALFFSLDRYSEKTIQELGIEEYNEHKKGGDFIYSIGARNMDFTINKNKISQGWIMGKKLIPGLKDFEPKLFNREEKKFVEFVIGVDDNGKEIAYTCDEDKLANYFGKNKGCPHFLTPVIFRKDVLTKYYSQPDKYSVTDGYLSCGGMWGLHLDNNQQDYVMVFLGDLGHLSYKEQIYWKGFNIATKGKISHTAWKRGIEGEFADPEKSDLFFKQKYTIFQEEWERKFGWKFFRPLNKEDEHHFKTLRIPLTNEQKEFDEQVLSLVKIFIDSLNEKELEKGLSTIKKDAKGIDKLGEFLKKKGLRFEEMFEFLRNLQDLRSTGVAHLKGSKYQKVKQVFSIGQKDLSQVFDDILIKCVRTLNTLESHFIKEKMSDE